MKATLFTLAAFIVAIAFNVWLDSGCALQGAITEHGKTCVQ